MDRDEKQMELDTITGVHVKACLPMRLYLSLRSEQLRRRRDGNKQTLEQLVTEAIEKTFHSKKRKSSKDEILTGAEKSLLIESTAIGCSEISVKDN